MGSGMWAIVVVGGFIVLGLAMAYAMGRNKAAGADEPVGGDAPPPNFGETREDR